MTMPHVHTPEEERAVVPQDGPSCYICLLTDLRTRLSSALALIKVKDEALRLAEHELTTLHNLDASDDPERLMRNSFTIDTGKTGTAIRAALSAKLED